MRLLDSELFVLGRGAQLMRDVLCRSKLSAGQNRKRREHVALHQRQIAQLRNNRERANQRLMPQVGVRSFNLPGISEADYIKLVDFTGREMHRGMPGKIAASEPKALTKLGLDINHWTRRVKGIGSGYWRVVGEVEELIDKAKEISQRTLRWDWLCSDFEKDLGRHGVIIFAALAARCVRPEFVLG